VLLLTTGRTQQVGDEAGNASQNGGGEGGIDLPFRPSTPLLCQETKRGRKKDQRTQTRAAGSQLSRPKGREGGCEKLKRVKNLTTPLLRGQYFKGKRVADLSRRAR